MSPAIAGEHVDGHDYAAAAVAAGAVCVLAIRPVGATVIGVTGSAGKTTTKDMLAQVLGAHGPTVATAKSLNTEIGLPLTVLRADEGTRYLVLEMGARGAGHIAYLASLVSPRVGLVINVGTAHVGEFGSREKTAAAKGELVEALPGAGSGGLAVLNADDDLVAAMVARTAARVLTFGRADDADVRALGIQVGGDGRARFTLAAGARSGGGSTRVTVVPDPGAALAAVRSLLQPGDVVLAKASHAMHLEDLAVALAARG
jgi:UDP-N-acetylmuramoyl-tripeptide--D-alanyl-D-alanine ligase